MKNKCLHDWVVKSDVITKSALEDLIAAGCNDVKVPGEGGVKMHVLIMACNKCGEIYKSVERNFK